MAVSDEDEKKLDSLIDANLSRVKKLDKQVKERKENKENPTDRYDTEKVKKTRMAVKTMCESDPLLEDSSEERPLPENGAEPQTPEQKKSRFFGLFSA